MSIAVPSKSTPPSLKKGFVWSLSGNFASLLGSWGVMMVLVHAGSSEMVGQYGISTALVAPIVAFSNLQLRGLQATDAAGEFQFGDYLGLRIASSIVAGFLILGALLVVPYELDVRIVALLVAVKLLINSVSDVFFGLFQQKERLDKIAQFQLASNVLNLIFFAGALGMTGQLVVAVAASAVGSLAPLVFYVVPAAKKMDVRDEVGGLEPRWNALQLRKLLFQAIPLSIVSLLISVNANLPRYYLADQVGADDLGIFVALMALVTSSEMFAAAMAQTVSPRLARLYVARAKSSFVALIARLEAMSLGLGLVAVVAAFLVGPYIVSWLYTPEYGEQREAIVWLAISAALSLMSRFVGNAITAARKLSVQVLSNVAVLGTLAAGCAAWIPDHGIAGATMAVAMSSAMRLISNSLVLVRLLHRWR